MKIIGIANRIDNILNVPYELVMVESAKELSDSLKSTLNKKGVDFAKYNSDSDVEVLTSTPPIEIYEYQNFFVLENAKGEFLLLDGFRRLLWYNAPKTPILVKIYKEKNLTNQQILTLLVNLNHFKFFSNQSYHERGFSLLLKTVFDIDITTFRKTFDAYLSSNETKNSYSSYGRLSGQDKNEEIKDRIIGENFISDIKFLEKLNGTKYLCDQYMGALLYEHRQKTDKAFDVNKFIEIADKHAVLNDLTIKYAKTGTDHSAKSQEVVNKIIEIYRNIFILMEGGEVDKSFAEKQQECRDLVAKLKKDKTLVKLTGSTNIYELERIMFDKIKKGESLEFICVIHPLDEGDRWTKDSEVKIPYGLFDGIKFLNLTDKHLGMGAKEMKFGTVIKGKEYQIRHNYGGYANSGKKYTQLDIPMSRNYDIDLFIRLDIAKPEKSKEPRQLKKFSYTPQGRRGGKEYFVLAWTNKEALELFESIGYPISVNYLRDYVNKSWGTDGEAYLRDVDQTQPAIYVGELNEGNSSINTKTPPIKLK